MPGTGKNAIVCGMKFINPGPEIICKLLHEAHSVAVLGLSPNASRPSYNVARALQGFGHRIIPVRPLVSEVIST